MPAADWGGVVAVVAHISQYVCVAVTGRRVR